MIQKIEFSSDLATLYRDSEVPARAVLLYFHGGGLLFGTRRDLPDFQKAAFLSAGYPILAFDYPLAPAAHLPEILASAAESIRKYPHGLWASLSALRALGSLRGRLSLPAACVREMAFLSTACRTHLLLWLRISLR